MKIFKDFIIYIKDNNITAFQIKSISECLSKKFNIPKSRIVFFCKIMKEFNMIEQMYESGNCTTICASCYEYGCDAGQKAPVTYWKVLTLKY